MKPDFIILGAMKCGTSTLAAQLGAQPGIFMTTPKEPNYFSDDQVFAKGPEWYASLFSEATPGDIKGEASTHYTKRPELPKTIERMTDQLPQVRLVYMIRNPMSRIISHYIHEWTQCVLSGPLSVEIERHTPLVDYGLYGWQIAPYVEAFGAESILLSSLERMQADPAAELARVAAHVGHGKRTVWNEELDSVNVSAERMRRLPMHDLLVDHPVAATLRRNLLPKTMRTWVREKRQFKGRPEIPEALVPTLKERFMEDRKVLAGFFPNDISLDLSYPFAS